MRGRERAFTLMELLVVVAIIALLMAILLPSLGRAKRMAVTANCLSNLRQLGTASTMYAGDFGGRLPYPVTTLGEDLVWFNVIDPYLGAHGDASRTGVAKDRAYMKYKQCPAVATLLGASTNYGGSGAQNTTTEYTRSYKMNSMLRRNNPYGNARVSNVPRQSNFVAFGDGLALDLTGAAPSQWENGQFSMEVNDMSEASPALRHDGGACIGFVDGHAERVKLPTIDKHLRKPDDGIFVKSWPSEFLRNGTAYSPPDGSSGLPEGVVRNPAMPLQWSDPGNLYR